MRFCWSRLTAWFSRKLHVEKSHVRNDSELIERLSHELRTLLTGIVGYSEFVETNSTEPMVNFTAKIIRESSQGLARTSNAFFDLHRLETGQIKIECSSFSFIEQVRSLVRAHQKQALEKDVNLIFTCSDETYLQDMNSDMQRVKQVVDSLIYWALQSVEKGQTVHIDASVDEDKNFIKLMFIFLDGANTGVQVDLLNDFWNKDSYQFRLQEGPGIELAFSKAMIFLLQGLAEYLSTQEELPRLIVKLPLRYIPAKDQA